MARIEALSVPITLGTGQTHNCLKTRDWTPLEPNVAEYKYFAQGLGLVRSETIGISEEFGELQGSFQIGVASLPNFAGALSPTRIPSTIRCTPSRPAIPIS